MDSQKKTQVNRIVLMFNNLENIHTASTFPQSTQGQAIKKKSIKQSETLRGMKNQLEKLHYKNNKNEGKKNVKKNSKKYFWLKFDY